MKVLHTVPFLAPHFGGVVERCYHISKVLAGFGHQVTVLTSDYEFDREYAASLDKVEVIPFKGHLSRFCYCPTVKGYLAENVGRFNVCHLMNHYSYINVAAAAACRRNEIPYLYSAMGALPVMNRSQALKHMFNMIYGYRIINNAARLIAITDQEADQYMAYHPGVRQNRIAKIPNAIYDIYDETVDATAFRRRFQVADGHRLILFVGRLDKVKGPDILIRAFESVIRGLPEATLAFVGPDFGALAGMRALIDGLGLQGRVVLCGPLFGRDKMEAYAAADVLTVPSRQENMSFVALEAAAWKVPVIITDTSGFDEIGLSGAGLVVRP